MTENRPPLVINEHNLARGLLGLVVAVAEILRDVMRLQALRRLEGRSLPGDQEQVLGEAFQELDEALAAIKREHGLADCVDSVRRGLDDLVAGGIWDEQ